MPTIAISTMLWRIDSSLVSWIAHGAVTDMISSEDSSPMSRSSVTLRALLRIGTPLPRCSIIARTTSPLMNVIRAWEKKDPTSVDVHRRP